MANDAVTAAVQNAVIALNNFTQAMQTVLPAVQSTSGTATAGAATLPANPKGFLVITLPNGDSARVPYYDP